MQHRMKIMQTCLLFAILIVLIMILMKSGKTENLIPVSYSSGASQRFKSEFSQPPQGDRTTDYNTEIIAMERRKK